MSYFEMFRDIIYDDHYLKDLSQLIASEEISDPRYLFTDYTIMDGERPDTVSNKFYEVPYHHWIILVTNNLTLATWPKSERSMEEYLDEKYGSLINGVNHYRNSDGIVFPYSFPTVFNTLDDEGSEISNQYHFNGEGLGEVIDDTAYFLGEPVTNRQYELEMNDAKKTIRILNKEFVPDITSLASRLLR